jgi:hypothetical protein
VLPRPAADLLPCLPRPRCSAAEAVEAGKDTAVTVPKQLADQEEPKGAMGKLVRALTYGTSVDIHEVRGWLLGLGLGLPSASVHRRGVQVQ